MQLSSRADVIEHGEISVSTRHNNTRRQMYFSEGFTMGPHIDAFCGEICLKLVDIDEELRYLKNTIREKARHAEPEVRSQLEKVMKRIACNQSKVAAARAQVEHWITDKAKALRFRNEEIPEDGMRKQDGRLRPIDMLPRASTSR